jgi:hypothetical protein
MLGSWRETYVKPHLPVPLPLHMDELVLKETAYFKTKYPDLAKLWRVLQWCSWYIKRPFGIVCGHLVYIVAIWYSLWPFGVFYGYLVYFSRFCKLYQEKSGNPERDGRIK